MAINFNIFGKRKAARTVFNATGVDTERPSEAPTALKSYLYKDPVLASNMRQISDAVFENYPVADAKIGKTVSAETLEKYNDQMDDVEFGDVLKNAFPAALYNGNIFLEVVALGTKLKELYVIDPEKVKVTEDDYGNPIKYVQSQPSGDKELPFERIIHIRMPSLRTGVWGESYLKPLEYALARKEVAENYLAGMIENLTPLIFINMMESANDEEAVRLKNELKAKRGPLDPTKVLGLGPDDKVGRVDMGTTAEFASVQAYIDAQNQEIIRILQIPPIVAGTVDDSNRSNSEIQEKAVFGRTIASWQGFFVKKINKHLFKEKLGWKDVTLEFPNTDMRKQEAAIVRAQKLKELGLSNDVIWEELNRNGVKVKNDFVEPVEPEGTGITKDINDMESRRPRDKNGVPQNEAERQQSIKNGTEVKTNG